MYTLDELLRDKENLERDIKALVTDFYKKYGLEVSGIIEVIPTGEVADINSKVAVII